MIHSLIGELPPLLGVFSVLMLQSASISAQVQKVGFEPQGRSFEREGHHAKIIENNDLGMGDNATMKTPVELLPASTGTEHHDILCEMCSLCVSCKSKRPNGVLPEGMLQNKDLFIFYSFEGTDIEKELREFVDVHLHHLLRKFGISPLRLWVDGCTIVVSLFRGVSRVCNCNPPPDSFWLLGPESQQLYEVEISDCKNGKTECRLQLQRPLGNDGSLFFIGGMQAAGRQTGYELPPLTYDLDVLFETRNRSQYRETFIAVSSTSLKEMIRADLENFRSYIPIHEDLRSIIYDRFDGKRQFCYHIGDRPQKAHDFEQFKNFQKNK